MRNFFRLILMGVLVFGFVGCGGGGGDASIPIVYTPQEIAIDKIKVFAQSEENAITPTVQDYIDVGIVGVDEDNLVSLNEAIVGLTYEDIDTVDEIQAILDSLTLKVETNTTIPINHASIFTSNATATVDENQNSAITLIATDADNDNLIFTLSGTDADKFDISEDVVTFKVSPNYEDKT